MVVVAADAPPVAEETEGDAGPPPEEFALAFAAAGSDETGIAQQEVLGWQCSYRRAQPELKQFAAWRARWSRTRDRWEGIALQQPRIRRPMQEQLEIQAGWWERREVRG